jgi:phage recombination protein Bet
MSQLPATFGQNQTALSDEDVRNLEQAGIIPPNTPKPQIAIFAQVCKERGLSPFSKEIHLVGYGSKYSIIVGINGFRKIAAESGALAGIDDAIFNLQKDGSFNTSAELKHEGKLPLTATVTVWRIVMGTRVPFTHTAVFSEFAGGGGKYQTMPFQMIGKVAEAFALRKGFSDRLAGLSLPEEEAAYTGATIEAVRVSPKEVLSPELAEKYTEVRDALAAMDTAVMVNKYYSDFRETELDKLRAFVEMFFERIAQVSETTDDLKTFWTLADAWHKTPELVKIITRKKSEIENAEGN